MRERMGRICRVWLTVLGISSFSLTCFALIQVAQTDTPSAFNAASIKPNTGSSQPTIRTDPGRLELGNVDLKTMIRLAYGLRDDQVSGPNWLSTVRFDVRSQRFSPSLKR